MAGKKIEEMSKTKKLIDMKSRDSNVEPLFVIPFVEYGNNVQRGHRTNVFQPKSGEERYFFALELLPVKATSAKTTSLNGMKRSPRQKKSTANHSQFLYDDHWQEARKKKTLPVQNPSTFKQLVVPPKQAIPLHVASTSTEPSASLLLGRLKKTGTLQVANVPITAPAKPKIRSAICLDPVKQADKPPRGDMGELGAIKPTNGQKKKRAKKNKSDEGSDVAEGKTSLNVLFSLPDSITIERCMDIHEKCIVCLKSGIVSMVGAKIRNSHSTLHRCSKCMSCYHMSCNGSTALSGHHFCPVCNTKQVTEPEDDEISETVLITNDSTTYVLTKEVRQKLISQNKMLCENHEKLLDIKLNLANALEKQIKKKMKLEAKGESIIKKIEEVENTAALFQHIVV